MPEFWEVRVTGPDGQTQEGGVDIWDHSSLTPEELAEYLVDIVREIVLDMAGGLPGGLPQNEGGKGERMSDAT